MDAFDRAEPAKKGQNDRSKSAPPVAAKRPGAFSRLAWSIKSRKGKGEGADHMGVTPFMRACSRGDIGEFWRLFSPEKAFERDALGQTPLMHASERSCADTLPIVKILLKAGNANTRDVHGRTALMCACGFGKAAVAAEILRAAPPKKADRAKIFALAARGGSVECLKLTLPFHDPAYRDHWGFTSLGGAIISREAAACAFLAPLSDLWALDRNGKPPLAMAAAEPGGEVLKAMLPAIPPDVLAKQAQGAFDWALHLWAARGPNVPERMAYFENFRMLLPSLDDPFVAVERIREGCAAQELGATVFARWPQASAMIKDLERLAKSAAEARALRGATGLDSPEGESSPKAAARRETRRI